VLIVIFKGGEYEILCWFGEVSLNEEVGVEGTEVEVAVLGC